MKKDYNREVMSDMQIDGSFVPPVRSSTTKTTTKPKISAIGSQKRTISTGSKTGAKSGTTTKSNKTASSKSQSSKETKAGVKGEVDGAEDKKIRTKLLNAQSEIDDLEKLNEENIKSYRFKSKRNKVLIVILSVLLALSIAIIVTYAVITRLKTNCNMYIHGEVDAVFIINGEEIDEFRTPANLQGNSILELNIEVKILTNAAYKISFKPECYQKGVLMQNTLIYEHNTSLFYEGADGYYYSKHPIQGGQTIRLCGGVILDRDYEETLNVDVFKMDFRVYFEKA